MTCKHGEWGYKCEECAHEREATTWDAHWYGVPPACPDCRRAIPATGGVKTRCVIHDYLLTDEKK